MDPDQLNDLVKETDPNEMGTQLESAKEQAIANIEKQKEDERKYQEKRRSRADKRVGIKTYRDYAAEELKEGGGTLTNLIMKERDREREERRHSAANPRNVVVILLSAIVVFAAIVIVAFAFIFVSNEAEDVAIRNSFVVAAQPLIFSDFRQEIYFATPSKSKIERAVDQDIRETAIPIGKLKHVYFTQDGAVNPKELVPSTRFVSQFSNLVPQDFVRQLDSRFMYGYYSGTNNSPFLIFSTSNFARAYASMLQWERDLPRELNSLFVADLASYGTNFQDLVLFNLDTRVLLDQSGNVVFGYTFLQDQKTLVFFETRNTLQEINTRNLRNPILR